MAKYLVGTYGTEEAAVSALERLVEMGYREQDITILVRKPGAFGSIKHVLERTPATVEDKEPRGPLAQYLQRIGAQWRAEDRTLVAGDAGLQGQAPPATLRNAKDVLLHMGAPVERADLYQRHLEEGKLLVIVWAPDEVEQQVTDLFRWTPQDYYSHYGRHPGRVSSTGWVMGRHPEGQEFPEDKDANIADVRQPLNAPPVEPEEARKQAALQQTQVPRGRGGSLG